MAAPLLTTKLYIPPIRPGLVPRPHLIERLNAGLRAACKLTLLSAPPGFGKTTLVSEWLSDFRFQISDFGAGMSSESVIRNQKSEIRNRVAWVSLDEGDNDPARFLAYLIAALQTIEGDIGKGVFDALASPATASAPLREHPRAEPSGRGAAEWIKELVTTLINQVASIPGPLVLVLDDYHLITAQPIHAAVAFRLDHQPGNLHVVIATRSDPPLPIARLRARGQLIELRQTDLRFTPDEATEFLNKVMQMELSANDVTALTSRTEGWIAGLQMAALALQAHLPQARVSMQGRKDLSSFVAAFTGSQHYILDYTKHGHKLRFCFEQKATIIGILTSMPMSSSLDLQRSPP